MHESNPTQPHCGVRRANTLRDLARTALHGGASAPIGEDLPSTTVARDGFLDALRRLPSTMRGRRGVELAIRGDGNRLELGISGVWMQVDCDDAWQGTVICSATPFLSLLRRPLGGHRYRLVYRDGRFCIGGWTIPARWDEPGPSQIELPIGHHDPERQVEAAPVASNRRVSPTLPIERNLVVAAAGRRLSRAVKTLAPLGITKDDLRELLKNKLDAHARPPVV